MYDIIYADPCWDYKGQKQQNANGDSGSAQDKYNTMTITELINNFEGFVKYNTAKDSLLFMWSSSPHLHQAIKLGDAWGFEYKTIAFIWNKGKPNPGYYTMSECEVVLVFKKKNGKIPTPRGARNVRQYLCEPRREHSRKPDTIRDRITEMFPTQRKLEMFARTRTEGWDTQGNQQDTFP